MNPTLMEIYIQHLNNNKKGIVLKKLIIMQLYNNNIIIYVNFSSSDQTHDGELVMVKPKTKSQNSNISALGFD